MNKPQHFDDADALARVISQKTGGRTTLALPLGLGKALGKTSEKHSGQ
jgi:hypothetical protein